MKAEAPLRAKSVPEIVRIVLIEATRRRAQGALSQADFEAQINRLAREEIEPKGLTLLVRDLPGGQTRYIVKESAAGSVRDMVQFASDGTLESEGGNGLGPVCTRGTATAAEVRF